MPTLTCSNIRTLADASIELGDGITLVAGRNGAGKTSLALALRACVWGTADPWNAKLGEDALARLMRGPNQKTAAAELVGDDASRRIEWPKRGVTGTRSPLHASPIALHAVDPTKLEPAKLQAKLIDALQAHPDEAAIAAAFADGRAEACGWSSAAEAVKDLGACGWDDCADKARKAAQQARGEWKAVARENYGAKKADGWAPEGFVDEPLETLEARVTEARKRRDEAVGNAALSERDREHYEALAGEEADAKARRDRLRAEHAAAVKALDDLASEWAAMPPQVTTRHACPECEAALDLLGNGELVKAIDADERARRDEAVGSFTARQVEAQETRDRLGREVNAAEAKLKAIAEAQENLAKAKRKTGGRDAVDEATKALDAAERAVAARKARDAAANAHVKVMAATEVEQELGPSGLRWRCLKAALDLANKELARLSEVMGCELVQLVAGEEVRIAYADRDLRAAPEAASESERFRARTLLQLLVARRDGSGIVVVDGADILDGPSRGGLMKLLLHVGLPALVLMTAGAVKGKAGDTFVPDLAVAGWGRSYWLEDGRVKRLDEQKEAA